MDEDVATFLDTSGLKKIDGRCSIIAYETISNTRVWIGGGGEGFGWRVVGMRRLCFSILLLTSVLPLAEVLRTFDFPGNFLFFISEISPYSIHFENESL